MTTLLLLFVFSLSCQQEGTPTNIKQARVQANPEIPRTLENRYTNPRYRFSIAYPDSWKLMESENEDGATFTHPDDPSILFRAYGSQPLDEFFTLEEIAEIEDPTKRFENYKVEEQKKITVESTAKKKAAPVEGELRYISYTQEGVSYGMLQFVINHPERKLAVECEAPAEKFASYKEIFEQVSQSMRLLDGKN